MGICEVCGNDHDLSSNKWTLSGHLCDWRADRPDEWKMDEFIQMALKLEAEVARLTEVNANKEAYGTDD